MKITAIVEALVSAGATPEQILAAVRAAESNQDASIERRRASDRERQKRRRENTECHVTSRDVTVTPRDTPPDSPPLSPAPLSPPLNPPLAGLGSRERLDRLEQACREAAGYETDPSPGLLSLAPILGLMESGMDLDADILPAIRAAAAKMRRPARSWEYFRDAVVDWHERRTRPVVVGISGADPPAKFDQWAKQRELVKKLEQKYNQKEQVA